MRNRVFSRCAIAAAVASTCGANVVYAQSEVKLEEVLVTATAREQSVQDIPYNISSMSGDDIEASGIWNETDLLRSLSGATTVDRGARNSGTVNSIIIRGLNVVGGNEGDNALNAVAPVSTYVDNTPMYAGFVLRDIQRVELLRGPQGTLYGSGALGGTVRYISNKPDFDEIYGRVSVDYSQTAHSDGNNQTYDALLNVPVSDSFALRGHLGRIDNDGVVDQVNAYRLNAQGEPLALVDGECRDPRNISDQDVVEAPPCLYNKKDADTVEIDYARLAARWDATDELSFLLAYQTQEASIGGRRAVTPGQNNARDLADAGFSRVYGEYDNGSTSPEGSERDVELLSLGIEWDLGFATLTSNTAKFDDEGVGVRDQSGLYADDVAGVDSLYLGSPRHYAITPSGYANDTFVQEFRLVSNSEDNSIDWLVGAFYIGEDKEAFNDTLHLGVNNFYQACLNLGDGSDPTTLPANCQTYWPANTQYAFGFPGVPLDENDYLYRRTESFQEFALYAELTYHLSDALSMTGGLRWFDNEQETSALAGFPTCCGDPTPFPEQGDSDRDVLFKLNVSYDISEELMSYATFSQGYRRGGVNAVLDQSQSANFGVPGGFNIQSFNKDTVNNYELGLKGQYETVSFSTALFYVDWDDPQLNLGAFPSGFLYAQNGQSAHTLGFEMDINGLIDEHWSYRASYTFVEAELDDDIISGQDNATILARDGDALPASPENIVNLNLTGAWELSADMHANVIFNAYYQDESKNILSEQSSYALTLDGFWMLNASAGITMDNGLSVHLYANNISDEKGITAAQPPAAGTNDAGAIDNNWYGSRSFQYIAQPRTLGLRLAYNF